MSAWLRSAVLAACSCVTIAGSAHADRIPAFARKYKVSCSLCHNPAPRLTAFGEQFAGNGFRMAAAEPARDTIATGDALLELAQNLPLAMRLDAYVQAYTGGDGQTDFASPYGVKLLAGGTISKSLSYYLYFFLFERGEVGGIEDAFVYVNDIFGQPIDVAVGQFQLSDPLFKRELRLEMQDYAIYRARIGDGPTDLTYDRGIMAVADVGGFTITGELVNGNGRGEALSNRRFDNDAPKNVLGHVSRELFPGLRLGALGYRGIQNGDFNGAPISNTVWMLGGDATVSAGALELNAQYIHREDAVPTFIPDEPEAITDGGFAELLYLPPGRRWYAVALYNLVETDRPLLNVRLGGPAGITRYETVTGGFGYLWQRNFRVFAEATWDLEQEEARLGVGVTAAY